ncbi:MAG: ABC transporter ATP-binding protein [Acidobacteria bacterium]|nr:ABC transporter ATP-binding protein [Acidobacteriota bacterium]MBI3263329.1 ABC transporter ATP-binding protein [Acidobacteriota bacterium]
MTDPFLRVSAATKVYDTRAAVRNLSLDVHKGESVVVLGPSGCGKTTLLRLIAGLERPDTGEIWIDGRRVAGGGRNIVPAHERHVALVFQDLALWPHLSVSGNLAFVVGSAGMPKSERAARIHDVLRVCRVDPVLADRYPHELSGGEQQRVALARALVGSPRVLLLDEPFSNLDPDLRGALRQELGTLQRKLALATIYVTHDREDAAALADRTVLMRDGAIERITSPDR